MFDLAKDFFKTQGWRFSQFEGSDVILLNFIGSNGKIQCIVSDLEKEYSFSFYAICGSNAPEDKRHEISELLTRLNYGKFLGNFEMDYDDGEIRYKTSVYYKDIDPTLELINHLSMTSLFTMDMALPGLVGVMFGGMIPLDAFKLINKNMESLIGDDAPMPTLE